MKYTILFYAQLVVFNHIIGDRNFAVVVSISGSEVWNIEPYATKSYATKSYVTKQWSRWYGAKSNDLSGSQDKIQPQNQPDVNLNFVISNFNSFFCVIFFIAMRPRIRDGTPDNKYVDT